MAKLTLLLNILGSPRRTTIRLTHTHIHIHIHTEHNVEHFRDPPNHKKHLILPVRTRWLRCDAGCQAPKCCLFKYFSDGGNRSPCHSPFYRHQQVIPGHAAAEGEPDGTSAARSGGVRGGSTTRHSSLQPVPKKNKIIHVYLNKTDWRPSYI